MKMVTPEGFFPFHGQFYMSTCSSLYLLVTERSKTEEVQKAFSAGWVNKSECSGKVKNEYDSFPLGVLTFASFNRK